MVKRIKDISRDATDKKKRNVDRNTLLACCASLWQVCSLSYLGRNELNSLLFLALRRNAINNEHDHPTRTHRRNFLLLLVRIRRFAMDRSTHVGAIGHAPHPLRSIRLFATYDENNQRAYPRRIQYERSVSVSDSASIFRLNFHFRFGFRFDFA